MRFFHVVGDGKRVEITEAESRGFIKQNRETRRLAAELTLAHKTRRVEWAVWFWPYSEVV